MRFFLYEIVARIVAIYLCFDCSRTLWDGLVERKIAYFNASTDFLDWFLDCFLDGSRWSRQIIHRDGAPVRYWMLIGLQTFALVGCFCVAIFGWLQPNT